MRKNLWELDREDIVLLDGKKYKWKRDFKSKKPVLGLVVQRELVNVENRKDRQRFIEDIDIGFVEVVNG